MAMAGRYPLSRGAGSRPSLIILRIGNVAETMRAQIRFQITRFGKPHSSAFCLDLQSLNVQYLEKFLSIFAPLPPQPSPQLHKSIEQRPDRPFPAANEPSLFSTKAALESADACPRMRSRCFGDNAAKVIP